MGSYMVTYADASRPKYDQKVIETIQAPNIDKAMVAAESRSRQDFMLVGLKCLACGSSRHQTGGCNCPS